MDTASHLLFGATLAGLSMIQPEVAQNPVLLQAIMAGTLLGSHAPDFDTLVRLRGYSTYIRVHRGLTHSIPALFLWPAVLTPPIAIAFGLHEHWLTIYLWTWIAVVLHVVLDWLNAYGVQIFRPFSKRWHHLDVLSLFDPFLFAIHAAGLLLWGMGAAVPSSMFSIIYAVSALYVAIRFVQHGRLVRKVHKQLAQSGACHVVPGLHWFRWQFVLETDRYFYTGNIRFGHIAVEDVYAKDQPSAVVQATMGTDGVRAFLQFAQRVHVCFTEKQDGYVVEWRDVRFWHNHRLPFGVDVTLDRNLKVTGTSLGWSKKAWDPPYV
ncbi:metal-dependent hydrolase [Paenibacillus hamazuiensis]|uniref:metal-dependent hydrolase n=1 Tax=Paenibacillus hamazuiensis TaxID=2936508 RepID=UPI00200D9339